MAEQTSGPAALPGDIIQITTSNRRGALVVVSAVRAGRVSGYMPFARVMQGPTEEVPVRLRDGEFARVGTAAIVPSDIAKAREALVATLSPEPAAPAAVEPEADDLVTRFDVVLRFNARTGGAGQTWSGRVVADCVGEALDQACAAVVRLPEFGASIFVTGMTADEVRS